MDRPTDEERLAGLREARRLAGPWLERGFRFTGADTYVTPIRLSLRHGETGQEVTLSLIRTDNGAELVEAPMPLGAAYEPQDRVGDSEASAVVLAAGSAAAPDSVAVGGIRVATDFLRRQLAGGPQQASQVRITGEAAGLHWRCLQAAASRLGVERRKAGMRGGWVWSLPKEPRKVHEGAAGERAPSGGALPSEVSDGSVCPGCEGAPDPAQVAHLRREVAVALQAGGDRYRIRVRAVPSGFIVAAAAWTGDRIATAAQYVLCLNDQLDAGLRQIAADPEAFGCRVARGSRVLGPADAVLHAAVDALADSLNIIPRGERS